MLKITECRPELLPDIDTVHFIESSIRGGVSYINTRFLSSGENTKEEIVYIDANVSIFSQTLKLFILCFPLKLFFV